MEFEKLPRSDKEYLIREFGLPDREERLMLLKFVMGYTTSEIAAEMSISPKSVGHMVNDVKKHMVEIAKNCYWTRDDKAKELIDILGWRELKWPILTNKRIINRDKSKQE